MFNKVILIGNLTKAPEIKYTPSGTKIGELNIAVSEKYKDKDGKSQEKTLFIGIVCFGSTADNAYKYLTRGSKIVVEGKLMLNQWVDSNGNKRSNYYIQADKIIYLSKNNNQNNQQHTQQQAQYQQPQAQPQQRQQQPIEPNLDEEDIPF